MNPYDMGLMALIASRGTVPLFLKIGTMAACFCSVGKYHCDRLRLKICLRTGMKISEQLLITKLGIPSSLTALKGLKILRALQISNSEMGPMTRIRKIAKGGGIPLDRECYN
jgi:hypothetical protein